MTSESFTDCTRAFSLKTIPFCSNTSRTLSAMSRSSRDISSEEPSSTVTCEPNEAYMEANSSPMYPPPTMTSCTGSSVSSIMEVLVYTRGLPCIPSIGGMTVSAPVLMNIRGACNCNVPSTIPTSTTSGPAKEPIPV